MQQRTIKKIIKASKIGLWVLGTTLLYVCFANAWISFVTNNNRTLFPPENKRPFVIVLGASVHGENLSGALRERMLLAIELYRQNWVNKILLSGDGTDHWYRETEAMERFALLKDIPSEALFLDEEGYSTYASLLNARRVYQVESAYIVSQDFHLDRALWIAEQVGINAVGIASNRSSALSYDYFREILARSKDFMVVNLGILPSSSR